MTDQLPTKSPAEEKQVTAEKKLPPLVREFRGAIATPNVFFDNLDYEASTKTAVGFHLAICVINSVGTAFVNNFKPEKFLEGFLFALIGGLILSAYFWGASKLLGGEGSFKETYNGTAFALAPAAFAWMPLCLVFAYLYMFYLFHKVLVHVQQIDSRRANIILGLACFLLVAFGIAGVSVTLLKIFGDKNSSL